MKDEKSLPAKQRVVGFDPAIDFPQQFGSYAAECKPSVAWDYKKPAIALAAGKLIHVVEIPRSWRAPHAVFTGDGFSFTKRTNAGDEPMTYEEVRMMFLGYQEKRKKLELLQSEIQRIEGTARTLCLEGSDPRTTMNYCTFSLMVLESLLSDAYIILAECPDLLTSLEGIRNLATVVTNKQQGFFPVSHTPMYGKSQLLMEHNTWVRQNCQAIIRQCEAATCLLGQLLAK